MAEGPLVARSWQEALEHLYAGSWQPHLKRHRSTFAYRGAGRVDQHLRSSLSRLGNHAASLEPHLLRNFIKYAEVRPDGRHDSVWHWLALAQHHGLPTRLLDWTYSPLVALHFVTENGAAFGSDGIVWCVDYHAAGAQLPEPLGDVLRREASDVFTPELLALAVDSLAALRNLAASPALLFLEPPSLDQRIVTQYALFSLLTHVEADIEAWMAEHPELCRKVIVAADAKYEIRDKLDQANVTERVLYPGLDGLCRWLTRYYESRDP